MPLSRTFFQHLFFVFFMPRNLSNCLLVIYIINKKHFTLFSKSLEELGHHHYKKLLLVLLLSLKRPKLCPVFIYNLIALLKDLLQNLQNEVPKFFIFQDSSVACFGISFASYYTVRLYLSLFYCALVTLITLLYILKVFYHHFHIY